MKSNNKTVKTVAFLCGSLMSYGILAHAQNSDVVPANNPAAPASTPDATPAAAPAAASESAPTSTPASTSAAVAPSMPAAAPVAASTAKDAEGGGEYLEKLTGIALHGFANMGAAGDTSTDLHRRYSNGFYLNNFDLYYSPDLGNRMRFLSEVVFEPDAHDQSPGFDAERLQAGYVVSKNLTVWVGRFHTPIGYYAIAYHHGMQLQTAAEKPRFLDFEDHFGIVPIHSNGLWLNGATVVGDQRLGLQVWISNSDRMTTDGNGFTALDFNMSHMASFHLAEGARAQWSAGGDLDGLTVGATVLHQTIDYSGGGSESWANGVGTPDATPNPNTGGSFSSNFLMYGAHAVYEAHGIEFLNEIYAFHNSTAANPSATFDSIAAYSQLAFWFDGISAPYVRYEVATFNQDDPFFGGQYNGLPYKKIALGYRYNLNENSALKAEVSRIEFSNSSATNMGQSFNDFRLDYSIRF